MLELRGVSKRFSSNLVIDNINLSIGESEFFALLGPSGCGKSTLLRMIAGLESLSEGEVLFQGKSLFHDSAYRRPFNMVFQKYALFPHMSVYENVAYGLKVKKVPALEVKSRVQGILELVKMEHFAQRLPETLSGGQQQRVALARALVNRPSLLLLDEPLSALDQKLRKEMQDELSLLQRTLKIGFIFVTHDQEEAMALADRIAIMKQGRIEQVGTSQELYQSPSNEFVANFMGTMNRLAIEITREDPQAWCVKLGDDSIGISISKRRVLGSGKPAQVLIRPESIYFSDEANVNQSTTQQMSVKVTVLKSYFMGNRYEHLCVLRNSSAGKNSELRVYSKSRHEGDWHLSWATEEVFLNG